MPRKEIRRGAARTALLRTPGQSRCRSPWSSAAQYTLLSIRGTCTRSYSGEIDVNARVYHHRKAVRSTVNLHRNREYCPNRAASVVIKVVTVENRIVDCCGPTVSLLQRTVLTSFSKQRKHVGFWPGQKGERAAGFKGLPLLLDMPARRRF